MRTCCIATSEAIWPEAAFIPMKPKVGGSSTNTLKCCSLFTQPREAAMATGEAFIVNQAQEPEYFHKLINIENYPDFLPTARQIADYYLSQADYSAATEYAPFDYTEEAFDKHMTDIYEGFVTKMFEPDWRDSGLLEFIVTDESGAKKTKIYPVGRMSC
jgi:hypothetical protein